MKLKLFALIAMSATTATAQLKYPVTKKVDQKDMYFGTSVADPYRWLEDDRSEETKAWVTEQNKVTNAYLDGISYRAQFKAAIEKVFNYPKYSAPFRNGEWYYFYKNNGLQNQSVLYRQKGLNGAAEEIFDPNKLSKDGTTRSGFVLNKKGTYAALTTSEGGSDWQTIKVKDMSTGELLADKVEWVKVSGVSWVGNSFYYSRYPAPATGTSALSVKNEGHQVWKHTVGTPQSEDVLVFEDKANPQRFHTASTSDDERFLFLTVSDRESGFDGNALYVMDLTAVDQKFVPIVGTITNNDYGIVHNTDKSFIIVTTDGAPNRRIVQVPVSDPSFSNAVTIIKEKAEPLDGVTAAGGKLFLNYLKDISSRIYVHAYDGKYLSEIKLPAIGTSTGVSGLEDDKELFYIFSSFTYPPTIYKYNVATGTSVVFRKPEVNFNPENYEIKQVFYPSKDGTKIPMFIMHKKGMKLDGNNVTLLYGYGGFNVNVQPGFSATLIPFLDAGGVYASANLRGGGEYGEAWHQAGMLFNKQNVFDDFIAAGEFLIKEKYTSNSKLALRGGSNGGLLVGAVINQRPDLARVAIPQVGVMDMLRFHKFTIGSNWIADYGGSEQSEASFKNLYAYSPIHNIKAVSYPSTLITTADHDDRVVPAHSFKYAATIQEMHTGKSPVIIRIDTNSGHGASNTKKNIEVTADIYSFIFNETGVVPKF